MKWIPASTQPTIDDTYIVYILDETGKYITYMEWRFTKKGIGSWVNPLKDQVLFWLPDPETSYPINHEKMIEDGWFDMTTPPKTPLTDCLVYCIDDEHDHIISLCDWEFHEWHGVWYWSDVRVDRKVAFYWKPLPELPKETD